jgi:hypothetical protein
METFALKDFIKTISKGTYFKAIINTKNNIEEFHEFPLKIGSFKINKEKINGRKNYNILGSFSINYSWWKYGKIDSYVFEIYSSKNERAYIKVDYYNDEKCTITIPKECSKINFSSF